MVQGQRVLVAMSGGVDSSLAAAELKQQGRDVVGVTLHLWDASGASQVGRCCAPEDREMARRSCDQLGIPHYVFDERALFRSHVVDPYIEENLAGRTPSPCVHCNRHVKLDRLMAIADELGAHQVATGHYCRVERAGDDNWLLLRGRDHGKDQSYFLYGTPQAQLSRLLFPLGELVKTDSRHRARQHGLPNWDKPDSQELCFVPDGDAAGFIQGQRGQVARPGPIIDPSGLELGRHQGLERFTVGQRRGLGVSGATPLYVLRVIPETDTVVAGEAQALLKPGLEATDALWCSPVPARPLRASVRIRYRHDPAAALVSPTAGGFRVEFDEPQRAIAPGQAAVIYDGERVLGGGLIS